MLQSQHPWLLITWDCQLLDDGKWVMILWKLNNKKICIQGKGEPKRDMKV